MHAGDGRAVEPLFDQWWLDGTLGRGGYGDSSSKGQVMLEVARYLPPHTRCRAMGVSSPRQVLCLHVLGEFLAPIHAMWTSVLWPLSRWSFAILCWYWNFFSWLGDQSHLHYNFSLLRGSAEMRWCPPRLRFVEFFCIQDLIEPMDGCLLGVALCNWAGAFLGLAVMHVGGGWSCVRLVVVGREAGERWMRRRQRQ